MKTISLHNWRERISAAGLTSVASLCLEAFEPLSPFAAQLLWVMQPTLGLVTDRDRIGAWAALLEDPQGVARLREALMEETHE